MHSSKACAAALLILSSAVLASASDLGFVHKKKYAMGTVFEIVAYDSSLPRTSAAIDKAFDEIIRLDKLLSNYQPDSELSILNRSAHFRRTTVSADLYRIVEESVTYSRISEGKFDITVAPLVDLWKTALREGTMPSASQLVEARNCIGYNKIEMFPPHQLELQSPCLRIDVGGIGKGYAVDRAAQVLRASGISRALIDAGGSTIYALGCPPGRPGWLVHMRDPSGHVDPQVMLNDNSLSTSEQSPPGVLQNSAAGHIIDPGSGTPVKASFAVSVIAGTATASDALSTALLLTGPEEGKKIVETINGSAAVWITASGEMQMSSSGPEIVIPHHSLKTYASQTQ
jgi:thiamine biosynthesis lipoprotein